MSNYTDVRTQIRFDNLFNWVDNTDFEWKALESPNIWICKTSLKSIHIQFTVCLDDRQCEREKARARERQLTTTTNTELPRKNLSSTLTPAKKKLHKPA